MVGARPSTIAAAMSTRIGAAITPPVAQATVAAKWHRDAAAAAAAEGVVEGAGMVGHSGVITPSQPCSASFEALACSQTVQVWRMTKCRRTISARTADFSDKLRLFPYLYSFTGRAS